MQERVKQAFSFICVVYAVCSGMNNCDHPNFSIREWKSSIVHWEFADDPGLIRYGPMGRVHFIPIFSCMKTASAAQHRTRTLFSISACDRV